MPPATPQAASAPGAQLVAQRTAAGQAELAQRERRLSQRQRTVLFLVDGQRDLDEIRRLAVQAGADVHCLDDLVLMGLVGIAAVPSEGTPSLQAGADSSVLPSSLSLQGDSRWSQLDDERAPRLDRPLAEARELLMRAVRAESPVTGALTLLRLRRARTRESLEALLEEVEQRLRKPHRKIIAAQTLRHVRHLLSLPAHLTPPVG